MKRVISCLLTITLLMSLFVNTYAAGISNVDAGKAIFLSDPIPQDAIDYAWRNPVSKIQCWLGNECPNYAQYQ